MRKVKISRKDILLDILGALWMLALPLAGVGLIIAIWLDTTLGLKIAGTCLIVFIIGLIMQNW